MNTTTIDATERRFGRLATEVALLLRGKNSPHFVPNVMPQETVVIENIKDIEFTGKKMDQKTYYHYSGYPGGMRERKLKTVFEKDPAWVFRKAVYQMLASNRLRDKIIKNLIIK